MKKYFIAIIAIALAFASTAFNVRKPHHEYVKRTAAGPFYYKYNLNTASGENTASNYSFISPQPSDPNDVPGCGGSTLPCVIYATGNMTNPDASQVTAANLPNVTETQKN